MVGQYRSDEVMGRFSLPEAKSEEESLELHVDGFERRVDSNVGNALR
jgi:hypothetical protein